MTRLEEIEARLSEIGTELDGESSDLEALEVETRTLTDEKKAILEAMRKREEIRTAVANGEGRRMIVQEIEKEPYEERAKEFAKTGRTKYGAQEVRSVLVSGGTLATPTDAQGINDIPGARFSSILDMVKIISCTGMGSNKVAYLSADTASAATQTEGSTAETKEPTFGFVTISPTSVAVLSYISKQAKKQTPLAYEAKVREQAMVALRKKAASIVTTALKASTLNAKVAATVSSTKGVVDEKTLRKIVLAYGGDESVSGGAVLFLNKADLIAFGDVRGTNDKKAIYEIIPDGANPNTGIIKDGGLSVRYCINSELTACAGTSQSADTDTVTMFYGNPMCFELDLFSDYEIRVSEDFAFDKLMDTIRGDVELGGDVVVKDGFVALTIAKSA